MRPPRNNAAHTQIRFMYPCKTLQWCLKRREWRRERAAEGESAAPATPCSSRRLLSLAPPPPLVFFYFPASVPPSLDLPPRPRGLATASSGLLPPPPRWRERQRETLAGNLSCNSASRTETARGPLLPFC